jgi:hypothetical protein
MTKQGEVDLAAHMTRRGVTLNDPPDTLLFVNARTGGPLTYNSWHKIWRKALKQAGLDWTKRNGQHLGLHDLRSMNRSIMNAQGVDQTAARFRFGHANGDPQSLDDLYSRSSPRQNRLASEKIHEVLRRVPRADLVKTGERVGPDGGPKPLSPTKSWSSPVSEGGLELPRGRYGGVATGV